MLKNKVLAAALASAFTLPALAGDFTASSNVSLVSDYLYRGISQTGANPAIQGGFDLAHASGAYAGVWGSSISWLGDAGVATSAGVELDTYVGFKNTFATDYTYDVGFLRYNYPGDYAVGATKADTNEVYGALGYKWVTAKLSYCLGDLFGVANAKGSTYIDLSASYPIADTGITLGAHYGKQTYKGSTADAAKLAGADPSYADYKLSVSKDFSGYVLGLAYSSTNASTFYTSPQNKKLGKGKMLVSLSRTF
jgi:uncharacterized protein (TIGR02001 family)